MPPGAFVSALVICWFLFPSLSVCVFDGVFGALSQMTPIVQEAASRENTISGSSVTWDMGGTLNTTLSSKSISPNSRFNVRREVCCWESVSWLVCLWE